MKTNHTPGPWEIVFFPGEEQPDFYVGAVDKYLPNGRPRPEIMAGDYHEGNGYPYEQRLADAHLIRTAPEMAEAMQELVEWAEDPDIRSLPGIIQNFKEILAKAKGL